MRRRENDAQEWCVGRHRGQGSVKSGMSLGWEALRVAYIRKILLSYKKTLVTTYSLVSYHGDYEDADLLPQ
ncbi:hypothetical protein SAMN05216308_101395 [Nitrosospira sp. Nsp13]|nr:hypothetical protein SAMN05216308_101395 [Nitrosospira sp. Nsp13]